MMSLMVCFRFLSYCSLNKKSHLIYSCTFCYIAGPKPLKCFTPPPDYKEESDSSDERSDEEDDDEEEEEDEDENDGVIRSSVKAEDEFLKAVSYLAMNQI